MLGAFLGASGLGYGGPSEPVAPPSIASLSKPAALKKVIEEKEVVTSAVATAEKGETLFQTFSDDVVSLVERVLAWDGKGWSG